MLADMGTKPNAPAIHKRFKYWGSGEQFLPPQNHVHYKYLQMCHYEKSFCEIIQIIKCDSSQNITLCDTSQDRGVDVGDSRSVTKQPTGARLATVVQTRQDNRRQSSSFEIAKDVF